MWNKTCIDLLLPKSSVKILQIMFLLVFNCSANILVVKFASIPMISRTFFNFYIIFLYNGIHNIPLLSTVAKKRVYAPEAHKILYFLFVPFLFCNISTLFFIEMAVTFTSVIRFTWIQVRLKEYESISLMLQIFNRWRCMLYDLNIKSCYFWDTLCILLLVRTALAPYWKSLVYLNCACVY